MHRQHGPEEVGKLARRAKVARAQARRSEKKRRDDWGRVVKIYRNWKAEAAAEREAEEESDEVDMKTEIIRLAVSVKIRYDSEEYRAEAIEAAFRAVEFDSQMSRNGVGIYHVTSLGALRLDTLDAEPQP